MCAAGRAGPACSDCALNYTQVGSVCVFLPGSTTASCHNGVRDGLETGIDCGGSVCDPCSNESPFSRIPLDMWIIIGLAVLVLLIIAVIWYIHRKNRNRTGTAKGRVSAWPQATRIMPVRSPLHDPRPEKRKRFSKASPKGPAKMASVEAPVATPRVAELAQAAPPSRAGSPGPASLRRVLTMSLWGGGQDSPGASGSSAAAKAKAASAAQAAAAVATDAAKDDALRSALVTSTSALTSSARVPGRRASVASDVVFLHPSSAAKAHSNAQSRPQPTGNKPQTPKKPIQVAAKVVQRPTWSEADLF